MLSSFKHKCSLLAIVFFEAFRTVAPQENYRNVREETTIINAKANKSYLLKKEHFAQLTSTVLHA